METGQRVATPLDVKVLARFYGLNDRALADLMSLAVEARKRGWWHDYRSLDEQTRTFLGLATAAVHIFQVEALRLPGLLQTEDYARALVPRLRSPQFWAAEGNPDEIIATRIESQQRVLDGSLRLSAIMDEAALSRKIGQSHVLPEQVAYLIELAELPNVDLQIATLALGPHPGLDGGFQILTFELEGMWDVVYLEGLAGNSIIRADDRPDVVQKFRDAFAFMTSTSALSTTDTLTWLHHFHGKMVEQID